MKKVISFFAGIFFLGLASSAVLANEGIARLQAVNGYSGQCFVTSVYEDGMYRVLGTCRDLKVSYTPEGSYYVLWAVNKDGKVNRLGEIERGKISTATDKAFTSLFVTVESDSYPRKASEQRALEASMEAIPYDAGTISQKPAPTMAPQVTPTPAPLIPAATDQESRGFSFGRLLGVIGRIIGIGILVLIVAGIVLTIVTKRKEQ